MTDTFRLGTFVVAAALVVVITYLRFCGDLTLPDKPPPPATSSQSARQLLTQSTGTAAVYQDFLQHDATAAGVHIPSIDDMSKMLVDHVDATRHVLELGDPPLEAAGLRLKVARSADDQIVMQIDNLTGTDLAYQVVTEPSIGDAPCGATRPLSFNAMVVQKGASETRTECVYRAGESIAITRIETIELAPLQSWYVSQVPPLTIGIDERIARGHRFPTTKEKCTGTLAQSVRGGLESGQIAWRDLVDFYARHRCQTYQFPSSYRAFNKDNERPIPVAQ